MPYDKLGELTKHELNQTTARNDGGIVTQGLNPMGSKTRCSRYFDAYMQLVSFPDVSEEGLQKGSVPNEELVVIGAKVRNPNWGGCRTPGVHA